MNISCMEYEAKERGKWDVLRVKEKFSISAGNLFSRSRFFLVLCYVRIRSFFDRQLAYAKTLFLLKLVSQMQSKKGSKAALIICQRAERTLLSHFSVKFIYIVSFLVTKRQSKHVVKNHKHTKSKGKEGRQIHMVVILLEPLPPLHFLFIRVTTKSNHVVSFGTHFILLSPS